MNKKILLVMLTIFTGLSYLNPLFLIPLSITTSILAMLFIFEETKIIQSKKDKLNELIKRIDLLEEKIKKTSLSLLNNK